MESLEDFQNSMVGALEDTVVDTDESLDPIADQLDDEFEELQEFEEEMDDLEVLEEVDDGGKVLPFALHPVHKSGVGKGRLVPLSFVDPQTGSPVIQLTGRKKKFGKPSRIVIRGGSLPDYSQVQIAGLQVTLHEAWQNLDRSLPPVIDDEELNERLEQLQARDGESAMPLFGRSLRVGDGSNLFVSSGWNPMRHFATDQVDMTGPCALRNYPIVEHYSDDDGIAMELALGPMGKARKRPVYASVSLLVHVFEIDFTTALPLNVPLGG